MKGCHDNIASIALVPIFLQGAGNFQSTHLPMTNTSLDSRSSKANVSLPRLD